MKHALSQIFLITALLTLGSISQGAGSSDIRERMAALTDHTQIHLLEAGRPTAAPALVFIPGWTMPAFLWNQQINRFSNDRLVLALDSRSQGDSSKTDWGNTPEQRAKDLREILSTLHISHAVLIGWSQGVQDVAAYIQQFGTEGVAGLVFVDSPVSAGPSEIDENREESQQFFSRIALYVNHPAEYCEGMVHWILKKPHPELNLQAMIAHSQKTPATTGLTMLIMDMYAIDRRPVLAKIDKPTLVIASAESPLLKAQQEMASAIVGAQFVAVKGAGHALFVDDPQAFNESLEHLLKSISAK
jgi:non-heme chloroperoxidase